MGLRGRRLLAGFLSLAAAVLAALYAFANSVGLTINQTYHPESVDILDHLAWIVPAVIAVIALVLGLALIFCLRRPDH